MLKRQVALRAESVREFRDPFVYAPNLPHESFNKRLKSATALCEYTATSDGYVAARFEYTLDDDTVVLRAAQVYTNMRAQKLYTFDGKQFRMRFCGINNFIDKLDCENTLIVTYSHNIKVPLVENLMRLLDDDESTTLDVSGYLKRLRTAGVDTNKLANRLNSGDIRKTFREICLDEMSSVVNGRKLKALLLRGVQKWEGNCVHVDLADFLNKLPASQQIGLAHYLKMRGWSCRVI